jgi:hypothetical protein
VSQIDVIRPTVPFLNRESRIRRKYQRIALRCATSPFDPAPQDSNHTREIKALQSPLLTPTKLIICFYTSLYHVLFHTTASKGRVVKRTSMSHDTNCELAHALTLHCTLQSLFTALFPTTSCTLQPVRPRASPVPSL